jgi:hypothetical protein
MPGLPERRKQDAALPELIALLEAGNYVKTSCRALGLNYSSLYLRLRMVENDDPECVPSDRRFAQAVWKAQADAEIALVADIREGQFPTREGGGSDWRAAAYLGSVRFRNHLSPNAGCAKTPEEKRQPTTITIIAPSGIDEEIVRLRAENEELKRKFAPDDPVQGPSNA